MSDYLDRMLREYFTLYGRYNNLIKTIHEENAPFVDENMYHQSIVMLDYLNTLHKRIRKEHENEANLFS